MLAFAIKPVEGTRHMTGFRAWGLRAALLVGAAWGLAAPNEAAAQQPCSTPPFNYTPATGATTDFNGVSCATISVPQVLNSGYLYFWSGATASQINVSGTINSPAPSNAHDGIYVDGSSNVGDILINAGASIRGRVGIFNDGSITSIQNSANASIIGSTYQLMARPAIINNSFIV